MTKKLELKDKTALVLGLGVSGRSAAQYLLAVGAKVFGTDHQKSVKSLELQPLLELGLEFLSDDVAPLAIRQFDFVVVSPGVPASHPCYLAALDAGVELIGEMELAARYIKQRCLGVTGTNGKTTVALMTAHILNESGLPAVSLGNSGIAISSILLESEKLAPETVFVVEVSSFQLETMQSRIFDGALLLNVTADHMDRYKDLKTYAQTKIAIADCVKPDGFFCVGDACAKEFHDLLDRKIFKSYGCDPKNFIYTDKQMIFMDGNPMCQLPKCDEHASSCHDIENLLAAYALSHRLIASKSFSKAASSFRKPPHRIQFLRSIDGVSFVDDSKGTNVDAVIKAVNSIEGGVILIAGGVDKGGSYTPWITPFAGKVRCICAIGQAAGKIKKELGAFFSVIIFDRLEQATRYAATLAKKGESVLLSPGCASFDMFRDYVERGEKFQEVVNSL